MKRQMVDEEAAWHALTFTQVHRKRRRQRTRATSFILFCCGPQCMHKQCNLFKSHCILLYMSRKAEVKIQDQSLSGIKITFIVTGTAQFTVCKDQHRSPALPSHSNVCQWNTLQTKTVNKTENCENRLLQMVQLPTVPNPKTSYTV